MRPTVLSVFLLGLILPYNSQDLIFATKASNLSARIFVSNHNLETGAAASPFVVAIQNAQIQGR